MSDMTKKAWNGAVALGCVAGAVVAAGVWGTAFGLAALERAVPGTGWVGAVAATWAVVVAARAARRVWK